VNAPVPIGQIADWLHRSAAQRKALVLMEAYFDESGTHGEALITSLAGYVATKEVWKSLEGQWEDELRVYAHKGVETFHMTHCIMQEGEFAALDRFFSRALIMKLSEVLARHDIQPIWSMVVNEDWDKVVTDQEFLARFPKPLDLCFEHVVLTLHSWAKRRAGGELVAPMFSYQPEYYARMAEIGRVYGSQGWYRTVLGPIAFGFPSQVVPLQAADFVSHQVNSRWEHIEYGDLKLENMGPTVALQNATAFNGMHVGGGFDRKSLRLVVERFKKTGKIV
jgi:hypothetical protein